MTARDQVRTGLQEMVRRHPDLQGIVPPAVLEAAFSASDDQPPAGTCEKAPPGWYCSLGAGHEGPCPTWPGAAPDPLALHHQARDLALEAAGRVAEARAHEFPQTLALTSIALSLAAILELAEAESR